MGDILKVTINLTVICALAGLILSATWATTDPVRLDMEKQERDQALKGLIPSAEKITPVRKIVIEGKEGEIYKAETGGQPVGYIVESSGRGYSSFIRLLVAVNPDYTVSGVEVLSHAETPGLGDQVGERWFKDQFKGKSPDHLVVIKGETKDDIQAISGATISSKAVTKAVKEAVETLKAESEKGGL